MMNMQLVTLSIRYLGAPLKAQRMGVHMYKGLIDMIRARITNWNTKLLSYVGRLHLIKSVLVSSHAYWAQIFFFPVPVIEEIERKRRMFLWSGFAMLLIEVWCYGTKCAQQKRKEEWV